MSDKTIEGVVMFFEVELCTLSFDGMYADGSFAAADEFADEAVMLLSLDTLLSVPRNLREGS